MEASSASSSSSRNGGGSSSSSSRKSRSRGGGLAVLGCLMCAVVVLASLAGEARAMPPTQCSPGLLDEVPPRIRKVCAALATIYELGSAMENYVNEKVPVLREGIPLPDSGVKRQDVDHMFLRFVDSVKKYYVKRFLSEA